MGVVTVLVTSYFVLLCRFHMIDKHEALRRGLPLGGPSDLSVSYSGAGVDPFQHLKRDQ